jgi:hypothetical protein
VVWSPIVGMRVFRVTAGMRQGLRTERRGFNEVVPWLRVRCGYVISVWDVFGRCFLSQRSHRSFGGDGVDVL